MNEALSLLRKRAAQEKGAAMRPSSGQAAPGEIQRPDTSDQPTEDVARLSAASRLRVAIEAARHWGELEATFQETDRAFQNRTLTLEEAEEIAGLMGERSRGLPRQ